MCISIPIEKFSFRFSISDSYQAVKKLTLTGFLRLSIYLDSIAISEIIETTNILKIKLVRNFVLTQLRKFVKHKKYNVSCTPDGETISVPLRPDRFLASSDEFFYLNFSSFLLFHFSTFQLIKSDFQLFCFSIHF